MRPCQNFNRSHGQCANMVAAHNPVICDTNCKHLPRSTVMRFCGHMGLLLPPLIPLIVYPAECMGDNNGPAAMASPCIQRHIRCALQCQDGTQSTLSGASREGDNVAMSPDRGDTSPPTKLPVGNGLVMLQCAACCAPQTQLRPMLGCDSDTSIDATPLMDNPPPLWRLLQAVPLFNRVP
jgi:hypothetical protein